MCVCVRADYVFAWLGCLVRFLTSAVCPMDGVTVWIPAGRPSSTVAIYSYNGPSVLQPYILRPSCFDYIIARQLAFVQSCEFV